MPRLGVNIDHVATLRQARKTSYPDPLLAAHLAEEAGADQITCHLREDRRHIQDQDLLYLRRSIKTKLNLEMGTTEEMAGIAMQIRPDRITLVPEKRQELTTEGGLNLRNHFSKLKQILQILNSDQIPVSLFINPFPEDIKRSVDLGIKGVELHTGIYSEASTPSEIESSFRQLESAARLASQFQLQVFAGHGLHYGNTARLVKIHEIEEYNIGHAIVARAVFVGIKEAVREMKKLVRESNYSAPPSSSFKTRGF